MAWDRNATGGKGFWIPASAGTTGWGAGDFAIVLSRRRSRLSTDCVHSLYAGILARKGSVNELLNIAIPVLTPNSSFP